MKVIALDIETKNLDMESEGLDFGNPNGWETSCVSIWDSTGKGWFYNYADVDELPYEIIEDSDIPLVDFSDYDIIFIEEI